MQCSPLAVCEYFGSVSLETVQISLPVHVDVARFEVLIDITI
jgi:hypothetical protein